jgi:hypothetical protein
MQGVSRLAEDLLASEERLYSMELVSYPTEVGKSIDVIVLMALLQQ